MQFRIVAIGLILVVLGSVVTVQLADPRLGERSPPDVDFSEPPSEIAADAATQFEYIDYSYRIDFRRNRTDDWRQVRTMQVDHTDREYYKTGPNGEDGVVLYGTDAVTFVRPDKKMAWRVTPIHDTVFPAPSISQPFYVNRLLHSNPSIVSQNSSLLQIHVSVHPLKVATHSSGSAYLSIDKQSGLIKCALVTYHPVPSETLYLRFHITDSYVNVSRPRSIPFSPREIIWDVVRGPFVFV